MRTLDSGSRPGRAAMWIGHYSAFSLFVLIPVSLAANLAPYHAQGWWAVLVWAGTVSWVAWLVILAAEWFYHDRRLCERCAGAAPLDTQAAVDRWDRALRLYHSRFMKRWALPVLIVLIGLSYFRWAAFPSSAGMLGMLAVFTVAVRKHRLLYPWCPYCRWDGGGDPELVPDVPQVPEKVG